MIRASRRSVMAGAIAAPAFSTLAAWRWCPVNGKALLYDPELAAGRRFADQAAAQGTPALGIRGDRIRFARKVFAANPAWVQGVSRQADAVLIEDVGREFGYVCEVLRATGPVLEWRLVPR